jgi:hypothetical protein
MFHYLFIGHFEHDRDWIRFEPTRPSPGEASKPVVTHPVNLDAIKQIVEQLSSKYGRKMLLESGMPTPNPDGFLVFDQYDLSEADVDFIDQLVKITGCEIYDYSYGKFLKPWDLQVRKPPAIPNRDSISS